jgi:prepilin-type N-terminal cleavage/methylation domain-containing protein
MRRSRLLQAGFTLVEVALAMAILSLLAAAVVPVAIRQVELQFAQRTAREVSLIQESAKWFYVDQRRWPTSIAELQAGRYLNPSWNGRTPWGQPYTLSETSTSFSVSAPVPAGVEGQVQQLVVTPSTAPEGANVVVTSAVPVPGREASLAMLVHKEGDWMSGPLELRDTHIAFASGGAPLWRAGLSGSGFSISDFSSQRLGIDRGSGQTSLTSVSAGPAVLSSVNAGAGNFSSVEASAGSFSAFKASSGRIDSANIPSLIGNSASFGGDIAANDLRVSSIGHSISTAYY